MGVKFVRVSAAQASRCQSTLSPDGDVIYEFTEFWQVGCDDKNDFSELTVLVAAGLPQAGELGASLTGEMYCTSVNAQRNLESPTLFDCQVNWKTVPTNKGKWNVRIQVRGVERTEDAHDDNQGNPVCNSAGDPFDPTLKKTYYDEEIAVQYNTLEVDGDQIASLRGKISSGEIDMHIPGYNYTRSFPAKTLKLAKADYECQYGNGPLFFSVSIVLHYKSQTDDNGQEVGWTSLVVDRGFHVLKPDPDNPGKLKRVPVNDREGNPRTMPAFLDGDGNELDTTTNPPPNCVRLNFEIPEEADLSAFLSGIG